MLPRISQPFTIISVTTTSDEWKKTQQQTERVAPQESRRHYGPMILRGFLKARLPGLLRVIWLTLTVE